MASGFPAEFLAEITDHRQREADKLFLEQIKIRRRA